MGEGTNRSTDIDEFDLYYQQLIIWDTNAKKIVGGYRIGMDAEIMEQFGVRGFYTHSLFKMSNGFKDTLRQSLELGRSFIVSEYQRKPLPLFLLWKGILYFLLKNPEYRYLIGPVSISNTYSEKSKELIIRYIMANFYDYEKAALVKPRNRFKVKTRDLHLNEAMMHLSPQLSSLDKFIGDVDQYNSGLPVLLKKYLGLNAKIIAFNVDPKFNNCVDGMIVLDIYDIPKETIESLSKEFNDLSLLNRFYAHRRRRECENWKMWKCENRTAFVRGDHFHISTFSTFHIVFFSIRILASTATILSLLPISGLISISLISVAKRNMEESLTMISLNFFLLTPQFPLKPLMIG